MAKTNLWLDILVLLFLCFLMLDAEAVSSQSLLTSNCSDRCGKVKIPFPFGMDRPECFWNKWYEIDCQKGTIPILKNLHLQVINISLPKYYYNGTGDYYTQNYSQGVTVQFPIKYSISNCHPDGVSELPSLQGSPFFFSSWNIFAAVGCNVSAQLTSNSSFVGCKSQCSGGTFSRNSTCSGFDGCCQASLPYDLQTLTGVELTGTNEQQQCNDSAFVASHWWLENKSPARDSRKMKGYEAVILSWGIFNNSNHANELQLDYPASDYSNANYYCRIYFVISDDTWGWTCRCSEGYDGNPYLEDGCKDINECEDPNNRCGRRCMNTQGSFHCVDPMKTLRIVLIGIGSGLGALLLALLGWWLYRLVKKRKEKKLREKYFKRNGGLKLQQQLLSSEGNGLKGQLFDQKEIEIATENFSESRILGKGGQGTVYKGMLTDGKIVAIKKALVIDEEKVEQFINEVLILTQISHRNIVQLLGCCLETEIPLLVYEFIPNGNMYEYLHGSNKEDLVSWEVRLQLAIEIAGALFYLHSAASIPVYHRDIKSTNILLDEKYQAKIADFGTSRLASLDQTHVTTLVQGTIGYLDPEYFQTNQFTDKSDVYSFGVVLVELLTRQKPISTMRTEESINLATYFILSMEDGHLFDTIDAEVLNQATKEEIFNVANLAQRCLLFHGRNRPTMREVATELERIKKLRDLPNVQECGKNHDQAQCLSISKSTSVGIELNTNVVTSLDVQPLLLGKTW